MITPISLKIIKWYQVHKRDLPWRKDSAPYSVWVAEIMSQQTRLETVLPYHSKWMQKYPTIKDLANASQQDVLTVWEGLGYYSRARNIHLAANIIVEKYNGKLPENVKTLKTLPGIGRYTAGAIVSQAFGQDEPAVDGNVKRVLARVFEVDLPIDSSPGERIIWALAAENLPAGQAGEYNQGLMELGALVCRPKNPNCADCPITKHCQAFKSNRQLDFPIRREKEKIPHYQVTAAVIRVKDKYLIAQRPLKGLLGGMWEFPGGKQEEGEDLQTCMKREIKEELGVKIKVGDLVGVFKHAYTHYRVTLHTFYCELSGKNPEPTSPNQIRWVTKDKFWEYPMGKLDRMIAQKLTRSVDEIDE